MALEQLPSSNLDNHGQLKWFNVMLIIVLMIAFYLIITELEKSLNEKAKQTIRASYTEYQKKLDIKRKHREEVDKAKEQDKQ